MGRISDSKSLILLALSICLVKITNIEGHLIRDKISRTPYLDTNILVYPEDKANNNNLANANKFYNQPITRLAQNLDKFHKRLTYAIFYVNPNKNVIFSPISVSTLLTIMAFGSRTETSHELYSHTGVSFTRATLNGYHHLINALKYPNGVDLNFATEIFASDELNIAPYFKQIVKSFFNTNVQSVNFTNRENAADIINHWCQKETNNQIQNIIEPDNMENMLMALINAIYFKGDWMIPFDPQYTEPEKFYVTKTKVANVSMMYMVEQLNWGHIPNLKTHYVELPYDKGDSDSPDTFSMYLLVPRKLDGFSLLEQNMHTIDFNSLENEKETTRVYLPKFKIQSKIDLKSILQKMGIRKMFDESADFRGMVDNFDLHVSSMTQKVVLEVNEVGSTGSAITDAGFEDRIMPPEIKANKPFLCAIVLKGSGIPLFYGKIVDPTDFS